MSYEDIFRNKDDLEKQHGPEVFRLVYRLAAITSQLEVVSAAIFGFLLLQIGVLVFVMFSYARYEIWTNIVFWASSAIVLLQMLLLISHQRRVARGNLIFSELSDELQWGLEPGKLLGTDRDQSKLGRPSLSVRYAMRAFAKNTSLPLIDGSLSTLAYFIIDLSSYVGTLALLK